MRGPLNADVRHLLKKLAQLLFFFFPQPLWADDPPIPLPTGRYEFQVRYSEHPTIDGPKLIAEIIDHHIELTNTDTDDVFPFGVIAEGTLMWNMKSQQWIIGDSEDDRNAEFVGGCSDGPDVVDLVELTYWTC